MIAILTAMEAELAYLKEKLRNKQDETKNGIEITKGEIELEDVLLVKTGIGITNASMAITHVLSTYSVEQIIVSGISGGVGNLKARDIVLANDFCYEDTDCTKINSDYKKGQMPGEPARFEADAILNNLIKNALTKAEHKYKEVSFYTANTFVEETDKELGAFDMETCAIAQIANKFGKKITSLRFISDVIGSKNQITDYQEFEAEASLKSSEITLAVISEISKINNNFLEVKEEELIGKEIAEVYTDGSYNPETKEYGYGIVFLEGGKITYLSGKDKVKGDEDGATKGELRSVIVALEKAKKLGIKDLELYYDCEKIKDYASKEINDSDPKMVAEYKKYITMMETEINLTYNKVKSHSGIKYNEKADSLARIACGVDSNKEAPKKQTEKQKPKTEKLKCYIATTENAYGVSIVGGEEFSKKPKKKDFKPEVYAAVNLLPKYKDSNKKITIYTLDNKLAEYKGKQNQKTKKQNVENYLISLISKMEVEFKKTDKKDPHYKKAKELAKKKNG